MSCQIHIGDTTKFIVTIAACDGTTEDVSTASTKDICLKDPANNSNTYPATFYSDGTDGKIIIKATREMMNMKGTWEIQGFVNFADGTRYSSEKQNFEVEDNICIN